MEAWSSHLSSQSVEGRAIALACPTKTAENVVAKLTELPRLNIPMRY